MSIKAWQIAALVIALAAIGIGGYAYMEHSEAASEQQLLQTAELKLADETRPDLPVNLYFRRALLSAGKVGIFRNTSGREIEFTIDLDSPATGRHEHRTAVLNPNGFLEIGAHQGWAFAPGQHITLNNSAYRPLQFTVAD
jgi:hypothetical protein